MARLRRDLRMPFATNMCVINAESLPPAIRARAADIILGDIYHWGGIEAFRELAAVCKTFGLGLGIHSLHEQSFATAVNLHLAAALPTITFAIDSVLHYQATDPILGDPYVVRAGHLSVPDDVGVGAAFDDHKVKALLLDEVEV